MITVKVNADFQPVRALLAGFSQRRLNTTVAIALTKTAQIAQKEVIKSIGTVFDRPTRWALGSTRLIPATPERLASQVWLKDRQSKVVSKASSFLFPEVFGGKRERKAYETALLRAGVLRSNEFTVPAESFPTDAYGNISVGVIRQILSQLKAAEISAGYTANKSTSTRSKRAVRRSGFFFVPRPGVAGGLPRGIYQRSGQTTRMVLKIVTGKPAYRPRLPLFAIGEQVAASEFQRQFDLAFEASLARLNARTAGTR